MDSFLMQASHDVLYKKILLGFLSLIPVTRKSTVVLQTIESRVADQLHSCWFVHGCIEKTTFQLSSHIYLLKNDPAKGDRWLEKLNRQKWKPDNHIWSVCRNTDNNTWICLRALLPSDLKFLDNAHVKIQNMGFKTSKLDQIALHYWYYSFLRPLRVDGRGFLPWWANLKKVLPDRRNQNSARAQKRVTVPLMQYYVSQNIWSSFNGTNMSR